ncbi:MAG: PIG-L family deacetylase [Acidimicrobiales bacterium]
MTGTLVCVHAHPDDESLFTAGATSRYGDAGHDVVLVTCTQGQLGIDAGGRAGVEPGHDDLDTAATRAAELRRAADLIGVTRCVSLGFLDSGLPGWAANDDPRAFVNSDVERVAHTLAALFDEVSATVVLTYDADGFYGHPDHIQANRVTRRAVELARHVERLYYPVAPLRVIEEFVPIARARGVALPEWVVRAVGVGDNVVATTIDARSLVARKRAAIAAHESQIDNGDLVTMDDDLFSLLFGVEYYQLAWSRHDAVGHATDLLGGLE